MRIRSKENLRQLIYDRSQYSSIFLNKGTTQHTQRTTAQWHQSRNVRTTAPWWDLNPPAADYESKGARRPRRMYGEQLISEQIHATESNKTLFL